MVVDYDLFDRKIYWIDVVLKLVVRVFFNGFFVEVVVYNKVEGFEGLVVDYIEWNLYWIDVGICKIEVVCLDGLFRRSFIILGIESLRVIIFNIVER